MKYNKVRGILRAKQGSQIPVFNGGGFVSWFLSQNPYTQGSATPTQLSDATGLNPAELYNQKELNKNVPTFNPGLPKTAEQLYKEQLYKKTFKDTLGTNPIKQFKSPLKTNPVNEEKPTFGKKMGQVGTGLAEGIGNFITNNAEGIMGAGKAIAQNSLDIVGDNFGKFSNTMSTIKGVADNFGPMGKAVGAVVGAVDTWANVINAIGGKRLQNFSVDKGTQERVGNAYTGSYTDINKAGNMAGKKVGLFAGAGSKNRFIDEQRRIQGKIMGIDQTNQDMLAMAGNDLNYLNYQIQSNGGYDQMYTGMRAKQGGKLQDKISLIKQRRTISNFINLDTKEIEQDPFIIDAFKEGGAFPHHVDNSSKDYLVWTPNIDDINDYWEPVIDSIGDYWEPVIDDIEIYREGGKTKEELETPEIEETSQKNLIPEGALHKNKHHMEHTEGFTQKGIPVIDNDGEQQAEIELDEIIFTLEVTKKLEEFYKEGTDEAAIEAGKLLVKEILFNTDDRTGLIAKCEEGGKL